MAKENQEAPKPAEVQDDLPNQKDPANKEDEENKSVPMSAEETKREPDAGGKPLFEKLTTALIKDAQFKKVKEKKMDKKGQEFTPFYLTLEYEVDGKQSYENFSGGRIYTEDGAMWLGPKSALGVLDALAHNSYEFGKALDDLRTIVIGKKVQIQTIVTTFQNKNYNKNIVKAFLGE